MGRETPSRPDLHTKAVGVCSGDAALLDDRAAQVGQGDPHHVGVLAIGYCRVWMGRGGTAHWRQGRDGEEGGTAHWRQQGRELQWRGAAGLKQTVPPQPTQHASCWLRLAPPPQLLRSRPPPPNAHSG